MVDRIEITTADVMIIRRCSKRTAQNQLRLLREELGKKATGCVTFREYCKAHDLPYEEVVCLTQEQVPMLKSLEKGAF